MQSDETEGRPLTQLGNRQWDVQRLRQLLAEVLPEPGDLADFVIEHDFERIGRRTMLLRRAPARRRAPGPGLGIVDLTERRAARGAQSC